MQQATLASTSAEWKELLARKDTGIIHSLEEWKASFDKHKSLHPLAKCDQKSIDEFTNKLTFKNGGLGHAEYGMIVNQLSASDLEALWGLFGIGPELSKGFENRYCEKPGTCKGMTNSYCTDHC